MSAKVSRSNSGSVDSAILELQHLEEFHQEHEIEVSRSSGQRATTATEAEEEVVLSAARRSNRVATNAAPSSDGDIWEERLAVCEGVTKDGEPNIVVRSYYRNSRTHERAWDEPPSGAGIVIHADADMRRKADIEKQQLEITLNMIPPDEMNMGTKSNTNNNVATDQKKKKGFFGRFTGGGSNKKKEKKQIDPAKDLNLQRAIALSMREQHRMYYPTTSTDNDPIIYFDPTAEPDFNTTSTSSTPSIPRSNVQDEVDDDIALAMALSISEAAANQQQQQLPTDSFDSSESIELTEEEMFQRALEASKRNMAAMTIEGDDSTIGTALPAAYASAAAARAPIGVASLHHDMNDQSYSSMSESLVTEYYATTEANNYNKNNQTNSILGSNSYDSSSSLDRKPAAKVKFDPYGK